MVANEIKDRIRLISPSRLAAVGREAARRAFELGLARYLPDGTLQAIPLSLTPEVVTHHAAKTRARDARCILSAVSKLVLAEPGLRERLARHLTAMESEALLTRFADASRLAIARVDWFFEGRPEEERHFALELNATIPAMEAYSDVAVAAMAEALAPSVANTIIEQTGRNADDLLRSLQAREQEEGRSFSRVALVHRPGDSQLPELRALAARWTALGVVSRPIDVDAFVEAPGQIIYRHIFGHRIPLGTTLETAARAPREHRMWNPIAGHLELKALLAELSIAVDTSANKRAQAAGLTADEIETACRTVPWTRVLTPALGDFVRANRETLVLKTSAGYGGKGVVIGPDCTTWDAACDTALAAPPDTWIVQRYVAATPTRHLLLDGRGAHWEDVFVDASSYTALADAPGAFVPTGGVCRFAGGHIVNIVGGGGVAPLLSETAAEILLRDLINES